MTQASVSVGFTSPERQLRLAYVKDDNLLPSEVAKAQETLNNINAGCGVVPEPTLTEAEQRARDELLHRQDQYAWPIRKLRLYPPVHALIRCDYGNLRTLHKVDESVDEVAVFSGTDQVTLEHDGDPSALRFLGRVYDEQGDLVEAPQLRYRGAGVLTCDRKIFGRAVATYQTQYRVIELNVTPTGENFDVQVTAFQDGQTASVVVPFEMLEFDTGQVAGVNCAGMGGIDAGQEPINVPPPAGRYQLISLSHPATGKVDEPLTANLTLRNINAVDGSGAVEFSLRYTGMRGTAAFTCPANGTVSVSVSLTPTQEGGFTTVGQVMGDLFSQTTGFVTIRPSEEEAAEWREVSREMSDVDVDGVAIKRIETVTMQMPDASQVKLVFDNSGVS